MKWVEEREGEKGKNGWGMNKMGVGERKRGEWMKKSGKEERS